MTTGCLSSNGNPEAALERTDEALFEHAVTEARTGLAEGGVPIGAALVIDGEVVATGRNRRVQHGSSIRHGETDCLERAGRLPAAQYARATMVTTLSPCPMCTGAILLYGIPRVLIGESATFRGPEHLLRNAGVEVIGLESTVCKQLMAQFIETYPAIWHEDIGEPG